MKKFKIKLRKQPQHKPTNQHIQERPSTKAAVSAASPSTAQELKQKQFGRPFAAPLGTAQLRACVRGGSVVAIIPQMLFVFVVVTIMYVYLV